MKLQLLALMVALTPSYADGPPKASPVSPQQKADTSLDIEIVPPDGLYEVTVKPKTPAPKGERGVWSLYPRMAVKTLERDSKHWRMKVGAGSYEVVYTTFVKDEQVDSFTTFTVGDAPPPIPPGPVPPPGPVLGPAWAVIVEQTEQRTPPQAAVLGSGAMWDNLKARGHQWRIYDADNETAKSKGFVAAAQTVGLPALLVVSKAGKLIHVVKMPETAAGIEETMKKVTGQ